MTKRTRKWVTVIALAIASLVLPIFAEPIYIVGVVFGLWQPWSRPAGVSSTAEYVSQIEAGEWFDCLFDDKRDVDICTVWDSFGRKLGTGDFRLENENRGVPPSELHPSWVSYGDGHLWEIDLSGDHGPHGKTLIPVKVKPRVE